MVTANNTGNDFNFYGEATVTSTTFPENAQIYFNFRGQQGLVLFLVSGGTVEYSFNGNTLHGKLVASSDRAKMQFDCRRVNGVWFRLSAPGSSVVSVEAWAGM